MKRIIITLMALLPIAVLSSFITMERKKEEKSLEVLWTEYDKATQQDRIQKRAELLEVIKVKALEGRADWDYYRACRDYVNVRSRRDWKQRDTLQKQMRSEILAYNEPLLIYLMDRETAGPEELLESVANMKDRLAERRGEDVYAALGTILNPAVVPLTGDDYEYVLWDMFNRCCYGYWSSAVKENVYAMLTGLLDNSSVKAGIAEYFYVTKIAPEAERRQNLESLARKYDGQALALLPAYALLEMEFNENCKKGTSDYFLGLKKRLESYEHERKSYRSGVERLLVGDFTGFKDLLNVLDTKSAYLTVRNGEAKLALRNLDKVRVKVDRNEDKIFETLLENPAGSFYALDTLALDLPSLDDGEYSIICYDGKEQIGRCHYPKYTLSVASRVNDEGTGVYVADYLSGKPLDKVDMTLYKGDRNVAEASGVVLDGFTSLPQEIASRLTKNASGHYLVCSTVGEDGLIRRSQDVYLSAERNFDVKEGTDLRAAVMLDRAAFNPGETVEYKSVLYKCLSDGTVMVMPAGQKVTVRLRDRSLDILAEKELETNEFGSVAGEFVLDGIKRNGYHSISVHFGDKLVGFAELTVDEFVLPTFDVAFEKSEKVFLPGDIIEVKGKVNSYSGHSLTSAAMTAKVTIGERMVKEEALAICPDGSFGIEFLDAPDGDYAYSPYKIEVKVTDLTGETLSFFHYQYVMRQPSLSVELENHAYGSFRLAGKDYSAGKLLSDETARISFGVSYPGGGDGSLPYIPLKYSLMKDGSAVLEGEIMSGETADVDFSGLASGLYKLVAEVVLVNASGKKIEGKKELVIVKVRDDDRKVDGDFENIFRVADENVPELQIGAGCGPVWAVVELYGDRGQRLKYEMLHLDKGEMTTLRYDYKAEYPDALVMNVLYFRDSKCHTYSHTWRRQREVDMLPLEFVRFEDLSAPGASCSVVLKTRPGSEVLASVFDVSTEQIRRNYWPKIYGRQIYVSYVSMNGIAGMNGVEYSELMGGVFGSAMLDENVVVGYGSKRSMRAARSKAAVTGSVDFAVVETESADEAIQFQLVEDPAEVAVRDDFSTSLAFEPFLRPSEDGTVKLEFTASDKISTFVVSVFAHDKSMNNNVIRREMLVTLPVKVSVVQPQYLYEGDRYVLKASLSNNSGTDVQGVVRCASSVATDELEVTVPAGGAVSVPFEITAPEGAGNLDFKVVFEGDGVSDGVLVTVPVHPASQVLAEAHSAVLLHGMSEEDVLRSLRERFVNGSPAGAEYSAVSVMDMLREALPLTVEAKGKDVISQSEAMYVNLLAAGLQSSEGKPVREYVDAAMKAAAKMLAAANDDGGFGWFEGMKSSPIVTAVVLERFAGLRDRKLLNVVSDELGEDALDAFDEAVVSAVRYMDSVYFGDPDRPVWYGCISLWQYLNVRSMYVGVPFDEAAARKALGAKNYNEFKKAVKAYLVPKKGERWSEGAVLSKVRMIRVIDALGASEQGMALAKAWGISSYRKLRKSLSIELESLKEYAVEHPSGGIYYPNAVLPWRGLLESEAYAHAMICDLFRNLASEEEIYDDLAEMADGIRLWIMLQKETQSWTDDPGFVEAMASVYDGSDAVKDTKVIILKKQWLKPFEEVKASGNGFRISVSYYRDGKELSEGDVLHLGESITAKYSVWSEENRSFVRLSVPRPACFRPVNQLSGWNGGWLRPLAYRLYSISPYAYREVKADRTLYWIDVFPEENSVIEEEFFVTQEGVFSSPAVEIESLYAPHYRANGASSGLFAVK